MKFCIKNVKHFSVRNMNLKLQKLINYKNWFCVVVVAISLCSCKPVTKVVLPYSGSIPKIKYLKTTATTVKKEVNYDNLIKEIFILSPKTKIVAEDKPNGNFQIVAYSPYKYKQRELQFSYRLTCNLSEKDCNIVILLSMASIWSIILSNEYILMINDIILKNSIHLTRI